jgi:hypothetical protein
MKWVLMFAASLLALAVAPALAQQSSSRSLYDNSGSFAGSSVTRSNNTSLYDKSGHFAGSNIRNSNGTTSFYDKSGRFTGSVVNTGPRR